MEQNARIKSDPLHTHEEKKIARYPATHIIHEHIIITTYTGNAKPTCGDAPLESQHLDVGVVLMAAGRLHSLPEREQLTAHAFVAGQLQRLQPAVSLLRGIGAELLIDTAVEHCGHVQIYHAYILTTRM